MTHDSPFPLRFEVSRKHYWFTRPHVASDSQRSSLHGQKMVTIPRSVRILSQLCVYRDIEAARLNPAVKVSETGDDLVEECIIDTGSSMSIIPRNIWSSWPEKAIEWLEPLDDDARKALYVKGFADEKLHARLGCIAVWLRYGNQSQGFSVINSHHFELHAKFLIADSEFRRVVFGMAGNAIDRWKTLEVHSRVRDAQFL